MKIREKSLTAAVVMVQTARIDVLRKLYDECMKELPNASTVTVTVREFVDDATDELAGR